MATSPQAPIPLRAYDRHHGLAPILNYFMDLLPDK